MILSCSSEDHPRVCGEKTRRIRLTATLRGSPPRVRGEDLVLSEPAALVGITPACAGRRSAPRCPPGCTEDHPRVCGEKVPTASAVSCASGSPPRVRGEVQFLFNHTLQSRITPACAGRSSQANRHHADRRDHPRVCGEKFDDKLFSVHGIGSPPRVRGEVPP